MTKIYEAKNHILIHTGYADPVKHRHMAAHIIISMAGEMRVLAEGEEYLCYGIMIPSGITHMVDTRNKDVLVFLYDCTTNVAKQIQNIQCVTRETCGQITSRYTELAQNCTGDTYCTFEKNLLTYLAITDPLTAVGDERISAAMKYIRSMSSDHISCQEVADAVHLSQSRFSHLFKEQVGMTFAAYLVYQRIMHVYAQALCGKSITEAALEAGFSSSSHFADVNRRVFGISASNITHNLIYRKIP